MGLLAGVADAAEPEPLDEEFLEYLAEFEDTADDWIWFASDDEKEDAPRPPVKHEEKVEP